MALTIRELAVKMIQNSNPNMDLRAGSPMYIYLADPLGAIGDSLFNKVEEVHEIDVDTRASMFFVDRDEGGDTEFTARVHFYNTIALDYQANAMSAIDGNGNEFYNRYPVAVSKERMALYNDGVYYYADIALTGDTPYSGEATLSWDNAPSEFAYITIVSVTTAGRTAETDSDLETRTERELALRNNISRSGVIGYISDAYKATLRDIHVEGFLDPEMNRDVFKGAHLGGCTDVYAKGDLPSDEQYKFDGSPSDVILNDAITIVFLDGPDNNVGHGNLLSYGVYGHVRSTSFIDGSDYVLDMPSGNIKYLPGGNILNATLTAPVWTQLAPNQIRFTLGAAMIFEGMALRLTDSLSTTTAIFLANTTFGTPTHIYVTLDRDIPFTPGSVLEIFEPIRVKMTYNPIGARLENLETPVLNVTEMTILDPLTDEDTDVLIPLHGGAGAGVYGGGGFGVGTDLGWTLAVVDPDLRYSMRETGFFEVPRNFAYERIGIKYQHDAPISLFDDTLTSTDHKAGSQDALAKSFVPCVTNLSVDIEGSIDEDKLREYVWGLGNKMSISDLITEMYSLGATEVQINDMMEESTYTIWKTDGTFVRVRPSGEGIVQLENDVERFLPSVFDIRIL